MVPFVINIRFDEGREPCGPDGALRSVPFWFGRLNERSHDRFVGMAVGAAFTSDHSRGQDEKHHDQEKISDFHVPYSFLTRCGNDCQDRVRWVGRAGRGVHEAPGFTVRGGEVS